MADEEEKTPSEYDLLSDKHKSFVLEYLAERHAATAYRNVYGNGKRKLSDDSCAASGWKLLRNTHIKAAISEKLTELWGNRNADIGRVYDELMSLAFSDIRNVMDFHNDGTFTVSDLSGIDTRAVKKLKIRKEPSKKIGDVMVEGADIIEIELYDKKSALAELAEILTMKTIKVEHSGKDGGPIQIIDYRDKLAERLKLTNDHGE